MGRRLIRVPYDTWQESVPLPIGSPFGKTPPDKLARWMGRFRANLPNLLAQPRRSHERLDRGVHRAQKPLLQANAASARTGEARNEPHRMLTVAAVVLSSVCYPNPGRAYMTDRRIQSFVLPSR